MVLKRIKVQSSLINETTNCYIIEDNGEIVCIDPGGSLDKIEKMIKVLGGKLKYIYLTHSHADHTECAESLKEKYGASILISRNGEENVNNPEVNMAYVAGETINLNIDSRVDNGDILHVGNTELEVINTPGHTNDGTSLYCPKEKFVITGDTMFLSGRGRTDLPTGNKNEIKESLKTLLKLPENTIVYPGHGEPTIIFEEK